MKLVLTYFSWHVFAEYSAYLTAAGSLFARNPTSFGLKLSCVRPWATSVRSLAAIEFARMTLQFVEVGVPVSAAERFFIFVETNAKSAIAVCLLSTVWLTLGGKMFVCGGVCIQ